MHERMVGPVMESHTQTRDFLEEPLEALQPLLGSCEGGLPAAD